MYRHFQCDGENRRVTGLSDAPDEDVSPAWDILLHGRGASAETLDRRSLLRLLFLVPSGGCTAPALWDMPSLPGGGCGGTRRNHFLGIRDIASCCPRRKPLNSQGMCRPGTPVVQLCMARALFRRGRACVCSVRVLLEVHGLRG